MVILEIRSGKSSSWKKADRFTKVNLCVKTLKLDKKTREANIGIGNVLQRPIMRYHMLEWLRLHIPLELRTERILVTINFLKIIIIIHVS